MNSYQPLSNYLKKEMETAKPQTYAFGVVMTPEYFNGLYNLISESNHPHCQAMRLTLSLVSAKAQFKDQQGILIKLSLGGTKLLTEIIDFTNQKH